MYICSCNTLTDSDVQKAIESGATHPRDVYAVKGCKAECGGCTRTIVRYLKKSASASDERERDSSACHQQCDPQEADFPTASRSSADGLKVTSLSSSTNSGKNSIFPCST